MNDKNHHITAARQIIISLGLPPAQHNERSALCLLALLALTPDKPWTDAENPLMGITPIMDWVREHYDKEYAPNTRETVRRRPCTSSVMRALHFTIQTNLTVL